MRRFLFERISSLIPTQTKSTVKRPRIVVTRPLLGAWREILGEAGTVVLVGGADGPEGSELERALVEADALVCLLTDPIGADTMDASGRLAVIGNCAVGVDNIDLKAAAEREIVVVHTPQVLTEATADLAMALLLAVARRIPEADRFVRAGSWTGWRPDLLCGVGLNGKRMGIVGYGRIGRATARRAAAFGMHLSYWGRGAVDDDDLGAEFLPLDRLLETSDVVSLHLPSSPSTDGILSAERIASMKPGALLINTARGRLVDEAALADALAEGRLWGAGLDVFAEEPSVHPRLLELDNVVVAPHIGSATREVRELMVESVCRDVARALSGEAPRCVVKRKRTDPGGSA